MIIIRTITAINRMYYVLETVQAVFPLSLSSENGFVPLNLV